MAKKGSKKRKKSKKRKRYSYPLWKVGGILGAAIFISFFPVLNADFVYWDDDINVYENPNVLNWGWESIKNIFTETIIGNYNPLPILSFAVEKAIFGLRPEVFHINNLILHFFNSVLVYLIGWRLKLNPRASIFLALLYAIHPMRVESVAWITERKDVLFGLFYWISILFYIRSGKSKKYFWYALAIFPLALLSKIQAVALPLSFLCIDYLQNKRIHWKDVISKWPFFILSLVTGGAGIFFLSEAGSLNPDQTSELFSFFERIVIGAYSYLVYLYKVFIPYPLSPLYPYPDGLKVHHFFVAGLLLPYIAIIGMLWKKRKHRAIFGIAFFTVNVIFVLQVVGAGQGFVADRFTYIGYFGLFFSLTYYLVHKNKSKTWPNVLALIILLASGVLTFQQSQIWKNSHTMWSAVIEYYPNTPLPYGNRGNYYRDQGQSEKAFQDYSKAIKYDSTRHATYNSRGKLFFQKNQLQAALRDYNMAIKYHPDKAEYYSNRGATHAKMGSYNDALNDLNQALKLNPNHSEAYLNRAIVHDILGRNDLAMKDLQSYLQSHPNDAEIWFNYALNGMKANVPKKALDGVQNALRINPNDGRFYKLRAQIYITLEQFNKAEKDAEKARELGTPLEPNWMEKLR